MGRHQSEKLSVFLRVKIRYRVGSVQARQLKLPLQSSLVHSIISKLFSFHKRGDAILASIARTRSISLRVTLSSSVLTTFAAVLAPDVSASALFLAQPLSASLGRKWTAANSDFLASSSARTSASSRWLRSFASVASAARDVAFCRAL